MIKIEPLEVNDCQNIVEWNMNKGEDFLIQWAGHKTYTYPITSDQIISRLQEENTSIFKIMHEDEMIGSIELFNIDKLNASARVCRFIMRDDVSGKGYGQSALKEVVDFAFNELAISRLDLKVFVFNVRAIRCYEKTGFLVDEYNENKNPKWNSFTMSISKKLIK